MVMIYFNHILVRTNKIYAHPESCFYLLKREKHRIKITSEYLTPAESKLGSQYLPVI